MEISVKPPQFQDSPIQAGPAPKGKSAESQLDSLLDSLKKKAEAEARQVGEATDLLVVRDPLQTLREVTVNELVPVFVALVDKYSRAGLAMQMDASNLLEGGREIRFEFSLGDHRLQLSGTATSEGIAFQQARYSPDFHGELSAGPMLRLRHLNATTFREFVCDRLAFLVRSATRRR